MKSRELKIGLFLKENVLIKCPDLEFKNSRYKKVKVNQLMEKKLN